ncbi:pyridoxamine 5'-phosphate oxidase family protein, partial [Streptomyces sp. NPDC007110]|uniref:pyridoxamine 5'-phosphate oxidase family protein n=1 Tax=Streptomyces sp. NPDC007110 TaxID=3156916 RepID=UPI003407DC0D
MTQGPAPRSLSDEALSDLLARQQFGTLATVKQSGHPHLTTMLYSWDPEARIVRLSTTADRIKVKHLQRNPRAALHVQGGDVWSFAVAEGAAEASAPLLLPPVRAYGVAMDPPAPRPAAQGRCLSAV